MKTAAGQTTSLSRREIKDLLVLIRFTEVYCAAKHAEQRQPLPADLELPGIADLQRYRFCTDCGNFLQYAIERRLRCPLDPKPACKHCQVHCYKAEMREKVREVMRFSGPALIKRGRLDLLWHYFF